MRAHPVQRTFASGAHREKWLSGVVREEFVTGFPAARGAAFPVCKGIVKRAGKRNGTTKLVRFSPRFGYAYFALFGDPLLQPDIDPYPDGYLAQMSASGMDGTWLHIVLSKLTPRSHGIRL